MRLDREAKTMTVPCVGICSDSKERGGSWVGPVTEATVASNAASGAEAKQARSVFSLLGLAPYVCLSLSLLASTAHAKKAPLPVPELTKEFRKHCQSLTMTDFTPYAQQLDLARRKAFVCREVFSYPETDIKDSKLRYAIRNYLDAQEPGTSKEWVEKIPDVLDSYSYVDSEIEKLQIVLNVFERFLYQDSGDSGPYTTALLTTPKLDMLTSKAFLRGRSAYHDKGSRDFGRVDLAMAYAAYHSIDRKKLFAEMTAWKVATPAYKRVVGKWLDGADTIVARMDKMAASMKSRSPASSGLFANTLRVYQDALSEAKSQANTLQLHKKLIARLIKGESPKPSECDIPLLATYAKFVGKVWKHGLENPIAARSRSLAETCIAFRDDSLRQLLHVTAPKQQALSPLSAAALFAQRADSSIVNNLGNTVKIELTYGDYYKTFLPTMVKTRPVFLDPGYGPTGYDMQSTNIQEGSMRIVDIKKVTIAGHKYLLIGGKGKKVKTPKWNCTRKKIGGWQVTGNEIRARTSRNCKIAGYRMLEPINYQPMLVPEVFGKRVKKGQWYKFLRVGDLGHTSFAISNYDSSMANRQGSYTSTALDRELKSVIKLTAAMSKKHTLVFISDQIRSETDLDELRYAMPICISKKPEACTSLGTEGNPWDASAAGAFDVAF